MGIGDWGMGIGVWVLGTIPNRQCPNGLSHEEVYGDVFCFLREDN